MKRVIQFSRGRYYVFAVSALLILIGVAGFIVNHGLNLGVDFKAGVSYQFQVAPVSFTVEYAGPDKAEISIPAGSQALTSPGDIILTVTNLKNGTKEPYPLRYADYKTVRDLMAAITKIPGMTAVLKGDGGASPSSLLPLPRPADITGVPFSINLAPGPGRGAEADIAQVRSLLPPLGEFTLQAVGAPANQEFITRIPVAAGASEGTFQQDTQKALLQILEGKYGVGQVILKSSDFVGARMAQSLASQTIWLVLIAVVLILLYMIFRFRPAIYGIAAVLGILHDALVMLSFDAVFRVEIDAGTIASILTILGYSINDTIVNFDRARENNNLMRGSSLRTIMDTSVSQTLGRTFITSGATLLTVIALFILTTGSIKNFALNMIVGIIEGTYSTFISAFIVIEWSNWRDRKRTAGELSKYGIVASQRPGDAPSPAPLPAESAEADAEDGEEEAAPEAMAQGQLPGEPATAMAGAPAAPAGQPGQQRPSSFNAFPGQPGSRKNKKHKRRHH
jgi:preprotein translocase subunit SecF